MTRWAHSARSPGPLARAGRHRALGIAALLTSVLAGEHGLTLLHYDADSEIAAEVIDFDQQWVVPKGSV